MLSKELHRSVLPRPQANARGPTGVCLPKRPRVSQAHLALIHATRNARPVLVNAAAEALLVESSSGSATATQHSVEEVKAALLDLLHGTERGLAARPEVRAEINEQIARLEAQNTAPTEVHLALQELSGTWTLYFSSGDAATFALLALSRLPGVILGPVQQVFDTEAMTVESRVQIHTPVSKSLVRATSSFVMRSAKRVQLQLLQAAALPPELIREVDLPSSLSLMGQSVDLSKVKDVLAPVTDQAKQLLSQLSTAVSQAPEVKVPLESERTASWALNTYVGGGMRITRGDGGAVTIWVKDT